MCIYKQNSYFLNWCIDRNISFTDAWEQNQPKSPISKWFWTFEFLGALTFVSVSFTKKKKKIPVNKIQQHVPLFYDQHYNTRQTDHSQNWIIGPIKKLCV